MTQPRDIPSSPKIVRAAQYLAELSKFENGLRRDLRENFGLEPHQIAEAVALSARMRANRRAFS
jgi:hypothetical protein